MRKRFLSLVLALCMAVSLLAAMCISASAADEADMVFDFGARASGSGTLTIPVDGSETASETFSADVTGNEWSAFVYSENAETISGSNSTNTTLRQYYNSSMNLNFKNDESWIAFLLPVEEVGDYDAVFTTDTTNKKRMNYGGHNFYFIPISDEKLGETN